MSSWKRRFWNIALATLVGGGCLFVNENLSFTEPNAFVTQSEARIGRPLTPLSYAGVARRTTRRAVIGGAAVGAAAYGAYGAPYYRARCGYYPYPRCY